MIKSSSGTLLYDILDKSVALLDSVAAALPPDSCIGRACEDLEQLQKALTSTAQESVVVFAGVTNVGKSTFLNALLNDNVVPVGNQPMSSRPVEFSYAPKLNYIFSMEGDYRKIQRTASNLDELQKILTSYATECGTPQNREKIIVQLPNALLKGGITLVDTPGPGATDGNSDSQGLHDEILLKYLNSVKYFAKVFWTTKHSGLQDFEQKFIEAHLTDICSDVIVNYKGSDPTPVMTARYEQHYRSAWTPRTNFHHINAKTAFGIKEIYDTIKNLAPHAFTAEECAPALEQLFKSLNIHLKQSLHTSYINWPHAETSVVYKLLGEYGNESLQSAFNNLIQLTPEH